MFTIFHLKSSFRSRSIDFFVFPSFPLFFPVAHCFRDWSKKNLKAYDIINCPNKNLITHFVWYIEKQKWYDVETLPIDRVLNKEIYMEKSSRKFAPKASPSPLFNFCKFAKTVPFFRTQSFFNGKDYEKWKGPVTSHSLG